MRKSSSMTALQRWRLGWGLSKHSKAFQRPPREQLNVDMVRLDDSDQTVPVCNCLELMESLRRTVKVNR